jgi:hypothetical protein
VRVRAIGIGKRKSEGARPSTYGTTPGARSLGLRALLVKAPETILTASLVQELALARLTTGRLAILTAILSRLGGLPGIGRNLKRGSCNFRAEAPDRKRRSDCPIDDRATQPLNKLSKKWGQVSRIPGFLRRSNL